MRLQSQTLKLTPEPSYGYAPNPTCKNLHSCLFLFGRSDKDLLDIFSQIQLINAPEGKAFPIWTLIKVSLYIGFSYFCSARFLVRRVPSVGICVQIQGPTTDKDLSQFPSHP